MSDFGENLPLDVNIKNPIQKENNWKPVNTYILTEKIIALSWGESIENRIVNFKQDNGKYVWGIEYSIPLQYKDIEREFKQNIEKVDKNHTLTNEDVELFFQEEGKRRLYSGGYYIKIPENILKIKILDLSPQEGMSRDLKSIRLAGLRGKVREFFPEKATGRRLKREGSPGEPNNTKLRLIQAIRNNSIRRKMLDNLFENTFSVNKKEKVLFESMLKNSKASEILIIAAHGGNNEYIGEQTGPVIGKYADKRQAGGNRVDLTQVIEEYDKPETFAAILVATCYTGINNPPTKNVPIFRSKGLIGGGISQILGLNKVYVSIPKENSV